MSRKVHGHTEQAILRRWDQGQDAVQIANALGRGSTTVYRVLRRNGIVPSESVRPKAQHQRKHTMEQEAEIVRRYVAGERLRVLAREFGCTPHTIRNVVIRAGVEVRPVGGPERKWSDDEIADILRRQASGESQESIASVHGTSQVAISRLLRQNGWDGRRPLRKGGRVKLGGYVAVLVYPDDPMASMRNHMGYVLEHRLVLARALGRPITRAETVHHKNGNKIDNRLENLELRVGPHGRGATEAHCPTCTCFPVAD